MKTNFLNKKNKKNKNILIFLKYFSIICILIIIIFRLTPIGRIIDDLFFSFLFGWNKYFLYITIIYLFFIFSIKKKIKTTFKKKNIFKIIWFFLNIFWLTGLISTIILNKGDLFNYSNYGFEKIFKKFIENFKEKSFHPEEWKKFLFWNSSSFFIKNTGGGIIGLFIATIFNYTYFIVAIILNMFSWLLMFSFFVWNHPLFLFFNKEKKDLIKWTNIKDGFDDTNFISETMNQIKDENITIEIPIIYKITKNKKQIFGNLNIIKKEHQNKIQEQTKEQTKEFEWEIPEIISKKKINIESNEEINNIKIENIKIKTPTNYENDLPNKEIFENPNDNFKQIEELNNKNAKENKIKITNVLETFGVDAKIYSYSVGPSITKFEISLENGVKVQKFLDLRKEFEIELADERIRIEAPIPGKSAVGIEVPNKKISIVNWKPLLDKLTKEKGVLKLLIGKDVSGNAKTIDLEKLPHLLIAGATGGGKSVCLLSIICSLIYKYSPKELKLLLIDPKKVELSMFEKIPHLISPIITENKIVSIALKKLFKEIKRRFILFKDNKVNKLESYNQEKPNNKIPYLVVIIDELADLIFSNKKFIEDKIVKIAQIARAAGIFLIIATQRPSINVVTGLIKANIPGRIAFGVASNIDSRTILNQSGAEKLLGSGDMLILNPKGQIIERAQGIYINKRDINALTKFWKEKNYKNYYWKEFENLEKTINEDMFWKNELNEADLKIYNQILSYIENLDEISISLIQRKLNIGFNRACKIVEKLETEGKIIKSGSKYKILK